MVTALLHSVLMFMSTVLCVFLCGVGFVLHHSQHDVGANFVVAPLLGCILPVICHVSDCVTDPVQGLEQTHAN